MSSRRRRLASAVTAAGATAALIVGSTMAPAGSAAPEGGVADWTMMVYAVGDTDNVAQIMVENLSQLAGVPDDAEVNVVVLLDLPEETQGAPTSTLPGVGAFDTAKLLVLDGGRFNEIRDLGEISMGRPDVLANFIEEAAGRFPAEKYALTLFDHGGGNQGGYIDIGPPGTTDLSITEIRDGMAAGMARAGIEKFDLLYHAACLMANYEAATALAPLTKTQAASEEIMFLYPLAPAGLVPLGENAEGDEVGRALVDGYVNLLDQPDLPSGWRELMAMSVIDSSAMARLDSALTAFSSVIVPRMDELAPDVARARAKALEFASPFGRNDFQLVDLGDFLRALDDLPPEVAVARDAAFAALEGVLEYSVTGRGTEQATGLNIWFPSDPAYVNGLLTDGTTPPAWANFLASYLLAVQNAPDTGLAFTSDQATVLEEGPDGIKVEAQLAAGELTDSATYVLTRMGDVDRALAVLLPGYPNAGGQGAIQGVWDYTRVTVSDGTKAVPVSTVLQAQSGGLIGTFETQYINVDGSKFDFLWSLLISSEGQVLGVEIATITPQGAAGVDPVEGGTVTPYIYVATAEGVVRQLSSQSIVLGPSTIVGMTPLPDGAAFDLRVVAQELSGRFAVAAVQEQVG